MRRRSRGCGGRAFCVGFEAEKEAERGLERSERDEVNGEEISAMAKGHVMSITLPISRSGLHGNRDVSLVEIM